jgi:hypothetical protein
VVAAVVVVVVSDMLGAVEEYTCEVVTMVVAVWYKSGMQRLTRRMPKYIIALLDDSAKGMSC